MLLIFDWDGTLCDSLGKIVRCLYLAAQEVGLPELDDETLRNVIGLGLPEALAALYPSASPQQCLALRSSYSRWFLELDQTPSALYEGVEETLTELRDDGFQLAVATSKSRKGLDRMLGQMGLEGFFHGSRCADETASKPNPRMLVELLADFGRTSESAVLVGDTEYDMEMARRAAMPCVAVSYGAHQIERLVPYQPILCLSRFADLRPFLASGRVCPILNECKVSS